MKLEQYLKYLNKNHYSKKTIETYYRVLNLYQKEFKNIEKIKNKLIFYSKSPNTVWTHYNIICSYMNWAKDKRLKKLKEIKLPKIPKTYRHVFKKDYLVNKTKILKEDNKLTIKKKNIIRFLFETGIRASELYSIIEINSRTIKLIGKGNKIREIFHNNKTTKLIKEFDFTTKTLRLWVKEILGKEYSPHSIRRSMATHMLTSGVNPKTVMLQLGHEKIETTYKYLHLSLEDNWNIYSKVMN